jgi:hypothetical protein
MSQETASPGSVSPPFRILISPDRANEAMIIGYIAVAICIFIPTLFALPLMVGAPVSIAGRIFGSAMLAGGGVLALALAAHFARWAGGQAGGKGSYPVLAALFACVIAPIALVDGFIYAALPYMPDILYSAYNCWALSLILAHTLLLGITIRLVHQIHWLIALIIGLVAYAIWACCWRRARDGIYRGDVWLRIAGVVDVDIAAHAGDCPTSRTPR